MDAKRIILKILALLKRFGIEAALTVIYDNPDKCLAIVLPGVNPDEVLEDKRVSV